MRKIVSLGLLMAGLSAVLPAQAQEPIERINTTPPAMILQGAKVKAGTELFFLSGQLASPVDPSKQLSMATATVDDFGDTKAQTVSTLNKIKTLLESNGYAMTDLVKLTLFVAADPKTGKMDFAGVNDGFKQFFGTAENPTTVARSTFQVAALVSPAFLIEIEAIAAKKP